MGMELELTCPHFLPQVHAVLALCLAGRAAQYTFRAQPGTSRLVEAASRTNEDRLYQESLQREPRGSTMAGLEPPLAAASATGRFSTFRETIRGSTR